MGRGPAASSQLLTLPADRQPGNLGIRSESSAVVLAEVGREAAEEVHIQAAEEFGMQA